MAGNRGLTPVEWLEGLSDLEHSHLFGAPMAKAGFFTIKEDHGANDYNPVCHFCNKEREQGRLVE